MTRQTAGKPRRPVAVALKHHSGAQGLPRVVASGKGHVAEQILELAFANGVRVREDADLVEVLSAIDVDSEIPLEAIVAVAEILAHVYRANGTLPDDLPPMTSPTYTNPASGADGGQDEAGGWNATGSSLWMAGSDHLVPGAISGEDQQGGTAITSTPADDDRQTSRHPDAPPETSVRPAPDLYSGDAPTEKGKP